MSKRRELAPEETTPPVAPPKEPKGDETMVEGAFFLSEALPVVPAKLVRRILRAEYVDMAELLKDNMEAERRRWQQEGASSQGPFMGRVTRREIPDVLSWLQCFTTYAAVVTARYPEKTRELLAYQAMIISEARRCGGRGWLLYDAAFRQQIRSFETVDFSRINQSLYSTTFLAYGSGRTRFFPDCMMADHAREECALHPNRSLPMVQMREAEGRPRAPDPKRRRDRATRGTTADVLSGTACMTTCAPGSQKVQLQGIGGGDKEKGAETTPKPRVAAAAAEE